jgi:hypothetical protein
MKSLADRGSTLTIQASTPTVPLVLAPTLATAEMPQSISRTAGGASTREEWLRNAVDLLRPTFRAQAAPIPEQLHVSVGFPSVGGRRRNPRIGECWSPRVSADGRAHLFISPVLGDPIEVLSTLVHELVHAAVGTEARHGPRFRRAALALGLRGKMTATVAGPELRARLEMLVRELGAFPHASLLATAQHKVQRTRLLKVECPSCGYTARITAKWIAVGLPTCPCDTRMRFNNADDPEEGQTSPWKAA